MSTIHVSTLTLFMHHCNVAPNNVLGLSLWHQIMLLGLSLWQGGDCGVTSNITAAVFSRIFSFLLDIVFTMMLFQIYSFLLNSSTTVFSQIFSFLLDIFTVMYSWIYAFLLDISIRMLSSVYSFLLDISMRVFSRIFSFLLDIFTVIYS